MILDRENVLFKGINRHRIQEFLYTLAKHYGDIESTKEKQRQLVLSLDKIKNLSKSMQDKKDLLSELKVLETTIKKDLPTLSEDNPKLLREILEEVRSVSHNVSMHVDGKVEEDVLKAKPQKKKVTRKKTAEVARRATKKSKTSVKKVVKKVTKKPVAKKAKSPSKKKITIDDLPKDEPTLDNEVDHKEIISRLKRRHAELQ